MYLADGSHPRSNHCVGKVRRVSVRRTICFIQRCPQLRYVDSLCGSHLRRDCCIRPVVRGKAKTLTEGIHTLTEFCHVNRSDATSAERIRLGLRDPHRRTASGGTPLPIRVTVFLRIGHPHVAAPWSGVVDIAIVLIHLEREGVCNGDRVPRRPSRVRSGWVVDYRVGMFTRTTRVGAAAGTGHTGRTYIGTRDADTVHTTGIETSARSVLSGYDYIVGAKELNLTARLPPPNVSICAVNG